MPVSFLFFFSDEQITETELSFDSIKHVNEYGQEFWYARELQTALGYKRWDKFKMVIDKAMISCSNSSNTVSEHFSRVGKTSPMPNGGQKQIGDFQLSRYAISLSRMVTPERKPLHLARLISQSKPDSRSLSKTTRISQKTKNV